MSVCGRAPSTSTATNRSRWPCTSTARVTRAKSAMRKGCPPAWSIPLWAHVLRACVSDQQSVRVEDRFARPVSPTAVRVRIGRLIARIGDHAGRRHRNIGAGERVRRRCAWRRRRARWRRAEIERRRQRRSGAGNRDAKEIGRRSQRRRRQKRQREGAGHRQRAKRNLHRHHPWDVAALQTQSTQQHKSNQTMRSMNGAHLSGKASSGANHAFAP